MEASRRASLARHRPKSKIEPKRMAHTAPVQSISFQLGSDHVKRVTFAISMLAFGLASSAASAQQKQHVSFKAPAANTKYTQQHAIDVGDAPGHQVRIYEIYLTFPTDAPVINGSKIKELYVRALSDYTNNSGRGITYSTYTLENGDKFSVRTALIAQSGEGGKLTATTVGTITGGTGSLARIKGSTLGISHADPKNGVNETQTDIDYWIEQ